MAHHTIEHTARYRTYIASPAWARKRAQYFAVHGKQCQACTATTNLHLHHASYDHLGDEPLHDLVGLCETCHHLVHTHHSRVGGNLRNATTTIVNVIRDAAMAPAGTLSAAKTKRRRQSKRRIRFHKRVVPMCLANNDTCRNAAPSGTGYCWQHDKSHDPTRDTTVGRTNPATTALTRNRAPSTETQRRLNGL